MAVSSGTRAFVLELFADLGAVTARAMMGGLAIYSAGRIFAIVGPEDRIYLKAAGPLAEAPPRPLSSDRAGRRRRWARRSSRSRTCRLANSSPETGR